MFNECEICGNNEILEKHHIISKSLGGKNTKDNLCNICSNCHTKIHYSQIIIEGRFLTTSGYVLLWHKKNSLSITNMEDDRVYLFKDHQS